MPLFAGALGDTVPRMVEQIGRDALGPGDVLLTNLPYLNGSHPPDGVLAEPVFLDDTLIGFLALRAHMGDLGGASFSPNNTTEVFQEGLLLPPPRFARAGEVDEDIIRIIRANSRTPDATAGDFPAGVGALRIGSVALRTLVRKQSYQTYLATVEGILDHGEHVAGLGVERLVDGVYRAEGALDDNGVMRGVPCRSTSP